MFKFSESESYTTKRIITTNNRDGEERAERSANLARTPAKNSDRLGCWRRASAFLRRESRRDSVEREIPLRMPRRISRARVSPAGMRGRRTCHVYIFLHLYQFIVKKKNSCSQKYAHFYHWKNWETRNLRHLVFSSDFATNIV